MRPDALGCANMDADLISAPEACQLLRIHRRTLDRVIDAGKLPVIRVGVGPKAHRRFRRADVLALLEPKREVG